jgi:hypothetical protein
MEEGVFCSVIVVACATVSIAGTRATSRVRCSDWLAPVRTARVHVSRVPALQGRCGVQDWQDWRHRHDVLGLLLHGLFSIVITLKTQVEWA